MKALRSVGLALVAMGLLLGPAARAEGEAAKMQKAVEKKVDFLDQLTRFERSQIKLGQLALQRSQSPRVREFATRMVSDHEKSLKTLQTWADGRALQIAALDAEANSQAGTGGSGSMAQSAIPQTSAKGAQKATEWSKKADQKREQLSREEPGKFDKEFLAQVIESQEEGRDLLKQGRKDFEGDTTLAAVLSKSQPVLEAHMAQAKSLKDML